MTNDERKCLALLDLIIRGLGARRRNGSSTEFEIGEYVTAEYNAERSSVGAGAIVKIEHVTTKDGEVRIEFLDSDECRQRALFTDSTNRGGWRMKSLDFECPICFGEGVNDGKPCSVCHGEGWGAQ